MEAVELLLNRVSVSRLGDPAPDAAQRERLFRAAFRAPDHGQLRPWRFLTVEGEARNRLGDVFADALAAKGDVKPEALEKARRNPLRAPLIVVAIARLLPHPKIPEVEQLLTAGCAAHGILLAAHAEGLGAIWRTGDVAHDPAVARALGLEKNEQIIGFLYLGQVEGEPRTPPRLEPAYFVSAWDGR